MIKKNTSVNLINDKLNCQVIEEGVTQRTTKHVEHNR